MMTMTPMTRVRPLARLLMGAALAASLAGCAYLPAPVPAGNWTTLYDAGSNLNDWTLLGAANWRIQGGILQADLLSSKTPSYLVSKKTYTDYRIHAEFWVDSQTNSGIFMRCEDPLKVDAGTCYEVNIWDTRPDPTYGTGAIVDVAKVIPMPKAGGRWNTLEITAKGTQLSVKLNGVTTVNVSDKLHAKGHVALQYGSGIVKFRRVLLEAL